MGTERVIGLDVGGTKILAGLVDRDGSLSDVRELETPAASQTRLLDRLDDLIESYLVDPLERPLAVGYGVPSRLDRSTRVPLASTNVSLSSVDLRGHVRGRFGLASWVENDANAAALAEWACGAGVGSRTLVMLTLGTGVGGGIVLDGVPYSGWAEIGHLVVDVGGAPCQGSCHGHGHLESFASGTAADRLAKGMWGQRADAATLVQHGARGDAEALEALGRIGRALGVAIGSLVNLFDPEVVVVGGGFGLAAGNLLLETARAAAREEALEPADGRISVVPAALGSEAGVIGAGLAAFDALERGL